MNFRAKICKNNIHCRRISTNCVVVWGLFRPGAIINYASWLRLEVVPYFLQIRDFKIQRRDGNENVQNKGFNKQINNFAHASRFFVHFFAVFAQVRRENA